MQFTKEYIKEHIDKCISLSNKSVQYHVSFITKGEMNSDEEEKQYTQIMSAIEELKSKYSFYKIDEIYGDEIEIRVLDPAILK